MARFKNTDNSQGLFLPINLEEQLLPGTFEWTLNYLLKLITGEMFAIDGCKLSSNASKEWSDKISDLKKKRDKLKDMISRILLQHNELDKSESAKRKQKLFKQTMGDDKKRRQRHIERLEKKLKKLDEFLEKAEPIKNLTMIRKTIVTDVRQVKN